MRHRREVHSCRMAYIPMLRPDTIALTALLALLVAFGPVATDMYVPSMPDIGRLLGASAAEVQLTLSSYLVGFAIGQIIYGPISDQYGRKPVLLTALVLFCAGSLACAAAPTIETLDRRAYPSGAWRIRGDRAGPRDRPRSLRRRSGRAELSRMGAIMSIAPVGRAIDRGHRADCFRLARQFYHCGRRRACCYRDRVALSAGDAASSLARSRSRSSTCCEITVRW